MSDLAAALAALRRPRLLIRAARFGICDYDRRRDLRRLIQAEGSPGAEAALRQLIAEEDAVDGARRAKAADYNPVRHIELLIAIMAEARSYLRREEAA
jgi:hypothetical protein